MDDDDNNFQSLSIDDRLNHKSWKARLHAYEELAKLFKTAESSKDVIFKDKLDDMRRAPLESNVACLDAALVALLVYIERVDVVSKIRPLIASNLIEKALGATRTSTRSHALNILLEITAADCAEPLLSELGNFLTHKQPKLVAASINAITEIIKNFGISAVEAKNSIFKHIPTIFQHPDKTVRSEGSLLVVELSRWIGPAISLCYEGLKPVQVKELQEQISKLPSEIPRPLRWKRGEQPDQTTFGNDQNTTEMTVSDELTATGIEVVSNAVDIYALADPVNVLEKITDSMVSNAESTSWKERKEALESILVICKVPKLAEDHYSSLVNLLVKRLGDVNVSVVIVAAQCVEAISMGLRKSFSPYKSEVVPALLERCKEKNKSVLEALRSTLDSLIYSLQNSSELFESYASFLKHKNPQVKSETLNWLSRCIPKLYKASTGKKEIKIIAEALLGPIDDGAADVRDAAAQALAALIKVAGQPVVTPFIDKLDKTKLQKVMEIVNASSATIKTATIAAPTQAPVVEKVQSKEKPSSANSLGNAAANNRSIPPTDTKTAKSRQEAPKKLSSLSYTQTDDGAIEIIKGLIDLPCFEALSDTNWKVRLETLDKIALILEASSEKYDAEALVRFFSKHPGWKDSNLQVINRVILCLTTFAEKITFSAEAAALLFPGVLERIGDSKIGVGVGLLFTAVAEKIGLAIIVEILEAAVKAQKSPKIIAETINWIANAILDFGINGLDIKKSVDVAKFGLVNTNPAIRTAAVKMITCLRQFVGPEIKSLLADLPTAQANTVDSEFAKVANQPVPIPLRAPKKNVDEKSEQRTNAIADEDSRSAGSPEDLIPRIDLTCELNNLIPEVKDGNWKIRKEGMDKAAELIAKNGNRIKLSNYDFLLDLKARYNDTNKNLIAQALDLSALIGTSVGNLFEKHCRPILGPAIGCLADNKPQVRTSALRFLSSVISVGSLSTMANAFSTALATESPNLRREALTWLAGHCNGIGKAMEDDRNGLIGAAITCLQDRTAEVRKAATLFLDSSLNHLPSTVLLSLCLGNKHSLLPVVKQIVDTHKETSPLPVNEATPTATAVEAQSSLNNAQAQAQVVSPKTPLKSMATLTGRTPKKGSATDEPFTKAFLKTDPQTKAQRCESDTSSWRFDHPRIEFCEQLKAEMNGCIATSIVRRFFADDYKDAVTAIDDCITAAAKDEADGLLANLDLLLKYISIRVYDSNPTILGRAFDLLDCLLGIVDEANLRLNEHEAGVFIPHLVQRAGELKESLRERARSVFRQLCRVYPASKIFSFLLDGLANNNKNARSRAGCLAEMSLLVNRNGLLVIQAPKAVSVIARSISDRDQIVRNYALNLLVQLHELLGESMVKHMAGIPDRDKDLFEERLKRRQNGEGDLPVAMEMEVEDEKEEEQTNDLETNPNSEPAPQVFSLDPSVIQTPSRFHNVGDIATPVGHQFATTLMTNGGTPNIPNLTLGFSVMPVEDPLDQIIQQIATRSDIECISALQRLDEYLADPVVMVLPKVPSLVSALTVRLYECLGFTNYNSHNNSNNYNGENDDGDSSEMQPSLPDALLEVDIGTKSRLCRYVINALVLLATDGNCLGHVDEITLSILLRGLLQGLTSKRLQIYNDCDQLSRAINMLLVKMLENLVRDVAYRILLHMLEEAFKVPPASLEEDRYPEMVMKCLWKLTKQLSGNLERGDINVTSLLGKVHRFLACLPPMEWKMRASKHLPMEDLPLRTVKTIIHEVVANLGERCIVIVRSLPNAEQSFVTSYVRVMLAANGHDVSGLDFSRFPLQQNSDQASITTDSIEKASSATGNPSSSSSSTVTDFSQIEERLRDICSKICSKPNTRVGLAELYELERDNPIFKTQIDFYLQTLGSFFYKYIKRNLTQIEMEASYASNLINANTGKVDAVEACKRRLVQVQQYIAEGTAMAGTNTGGMVSGQTNVNDDTGSLGIDDQKSLSTPIRNRLDSPAAKASSLKKSPFTKNDATPVKDSTIMSLKERLAKLRQGDQ